MTADPSRFAQRVIAAFAARSHHTDLEIEKAGGPSDSTMTKYRKAAAGEIALAKPREPTWSKIDEAAGWERGSARRVWDGGDPTPIVSGTPQDAPRYVEAPGERVQSGVGNEDLLREILRVRAESDQIRAEQREQRVLLESLSHRVEALEEPGT